jgi:hypothetical protein
MDTDWIITIRTTENIQLHSDRPEELTQIHGQVVRLLRDDDPELIGYERGNIDNYEALDREWIIKRNPEISSYTYISFAVDFGPEVFDGFRKYGANIINRVVQLLENREVKLLSVAIKEHELVDEVHLRFR